MTPPEGFLGTVSHLGDTHTSGTIKTDDGADLHFHASAVEATSIKGLRIGARVSYRTIVNINGGQNAIAVLVCEGKRSAAAPSRNRATMGWPIRFRRSR
jgi:cold shock CspA family protein